MTTRDYVDVVRYVEDREDSGYSQLSRRLNRLEKYVATARLTAAQKRKITSIINGDETDIAER